MDEKSEEKSLMSLMPKWSPLQRIFIGRNVQDYLEALQQIEMRQNDTAKAQNRMQEQLKEQSKTLDNKVEAFLQEKAAFEKRVQEFEEQLKSFKIEQARTTEAFREKHEIPPEIPEEAIQRDQFFIKELEAIRDSIKKGDAVIKATKGTELIRKDEHILNMKKAREKARVIALVALYRDLLPEDELPLFSIDR